MIFDMPQVPFEVYDVAYDKTVYVVSSCDKKRKDSITITLKDDANGVERIVRVVMDKAFDRPGITRVQICRSITK